MDDLTLTEVIIHVIACELKWRYRNVHVDEARFMQFLVTSDVTTFVILTIPNKTYRLHVCNDGFLTVTENDSGPLRLFVFSSGTGMQVFVTRFAPVL